LLLDRESRVLFFHGATADYVAPRGVPSTGLARLLRADVRRVALGTVQEARRTGVPAQARLSVLRHAQHVSLQLLAEPVPAGPGEAAMLLMFEQPADGSGGAPASADAERDNEVHRLREDVAAMEREGEAALGELRVAHEEAMSLNEELQSSNEELQTSKEELQSMNEELVSVNAQLEEKIGELERALGDVRNLMDATQVPTLFLDRELRIRRYTEPTRRLFHLIDADMGRALRDIAGRVDDPTLLADAAAVRDGQVPAEREVADVDGRRYLRRLAPYRLRDDRVDGVVVTYLDITVLLRAAADARRLAAVLDSSNDAVLAYDFEGRIRFWNRGACTIYGHDDDAAKELNIAQLEPPSDRGAAMRVATEARQSVASVGPLHARRLTRAGQVLDVSVTVSALKDEAGLPIAVLSTERDLSDTLRLEAEVRFRTMGDLVPALLRIEDAHGRAEYMNAAWVAFTGVPSSERLLGTGWHVYVHPDDLRVLVEQERRSRDGQRRLECDLRLRGHDGVYRWTRSTAVARVDPNGGLLGYICLSVDIQERKLAEQALAQEAARKDEFLAMLAHELRNPLAPIGNAVALIEGSGKEDPKLRWATGVIARQVEQMARLVDDLMDVARVATGKIKLEMTLLDLRAVVERARDLAAPAIAAREQRLRLHLPDAPVHVEGDLVRLTQVVSNLLNNASKYSERGGRIGVVVSAEAQTAVLRVQDNGAGISADMLPRVFDLFSQEDKTLDRAQGGLGIGLALVQRLVTAQGGRVEAHSDGRGRGSEFVVKLPLLSLEASAAPAEQAQGPAPLAVPCRVLIVDDNADSAETLAMLLSHAGHRVETAADGPSALASALEIRPDVIVLDIGLPGMTGYEVAQRLRAEPSMASTFLIALTGYGRPEDAQLAQAAGFDVHLVKPVSPRVLLDLLAQRAARPGPGPGEPARA
jgi:two-component system CheB/CheR fusion protein